MIEIMKEGKMWIGDIKLLLALEHLPQLSPTSHSTQRDFMPSSRFYASTILASTVKLHMFFSKMLGGEDRKKIWTVMGSMVSTQGVFSVVRYT